MNDDVKQILLENNRMLKELLEIARKITDPDNLAKENENDFYMAILANLAAKKIENKLGI